MEKIKFSDCTAEFMQDTFDLTQIWDNATLAQWLDASQPIGLTDFEHVVLEQLRQTFLKNGDTWNEIELVTYLSSPLLVLADFNTPYFRLFAKRHISAIVGEHELYGEPATFIARGTYSPKTPFFCFHECKRFEESQGKTRGQLLAAMLAAQTNNQHPHPIYGMYVIDQAWYFAILQGKIYSVSHSFAADTEAIVDIFKILKALKIILLDIAKSE